MRDDETTKTTREIADEYLREEYSIRLSDLDGEETNRLAHQRDLSLRQAKVTLQSLQVIRMALCENRPLEALQTVDLTIENLESLLDDFEAMADGDSE